jgi:hypothetical protein
LTLSPSAVVFGALLLALGLTAVGDTQARSPAAAAAMFARDGGGAYDPSELRVLDWTLFNISKYYVEPERIDPHRMTIAGMEGLEQAIPQVLVQPLGDPATAKVVRVRVGTAERDFELGEVEALWSVGKRLREVFRFVRRSSELDDDALRAAIRARSVDDATIRTQVAAVPEAKRKVVTSHDAFGYFGAAYGIRFVSPQGVSTESEPSAQQVAALIRQIRAEAITAVFMENMANPATLRRVAAEARVQMGGRLYADALSEPTGLAPSYEAMFRHNVGLLVAAMRGNPAG